MVKTCFSVYSDSPLDPSQISSPILQTESAGKTATTQKYFTQPHRKTVLYYIAVYGLDSYMKYHLDD